MTFDSLVDTLVRRRFVAGAIVGVAVLSSPLLAKVIHTTYTGTASVLMLSTDPGHVLMPVSDLSVMIMSPDVLRPVRDHFKLPMSIDKFRSKLSVKASPKSAVVPITYRDTDRKLARDVPNMIADQTVLYFHSLAGKQYDSLSTYLQKAANQQRDEVARLDAQLQHVAQQQPTVAADDSTTRLSQRLADLTALRAAAYATLVADEATSKATADQPPQLAAVVRNETLAADPTVQAIRANAGKDTATLALQRAQYTAKYPGLPSLQTQVDSEKSSLSAAEQQAMSHGPSSAVYSQTVLDHQHAASTAAADRARLAALDTQVAEARSNLGVLTTSGVNADDLRVRLASARAAYAALTLRQNETKADQAQASSLASLVVIDRVIAAYARIPAVVLAILTAVIVLILAISGALLWDALDNGLRKPVDIEQLYGRPLYSTIGSKQQR